MGMRVFRHAGLLALAVVLTASGAPGAEADFRLVDAVTRQDWQAVRILLAEGVDADAPAG